MELNDKRLWLDADGRLFVKYYAKTRKKEVPFYGYIEQCSQCGKKYYTANCMKRSRKRDFVLCENCARTGKNNGNWTTGKFRGKAKYKVKDLGNGHRKSYHSWLWEQHYGKVPPKHLVHHKNGNKMDNRLENLECMSYIQHNSFHAKDRKIWNTGLTAKTSSKLARTVKRATKVRRRNYLEKCRIIYEHKNSTGETYGQMIEKFNRSDRQLCSGYLKYENYLKKKGLPVHRNYEECKKRGCKRRLYRQEFCRKHYEAQNPGSKYYGATR